MEKLNFEQLSKNIEAVLKVMTLMSKVAVLVGGVCISAYALKIGYFPQGLTIGDGLLFILIAVCFGLIYVIFVVSLLSLGVVLSPVVKVASKLYLWTYRFRKKARPAQVYEFAKFKLTYLVFAAFAVIFIISLGSKDTNAYWNLPLLSIAMYFFYSTYLSAGDKINVIENSLQSVFKIEADVNSIKGKIENLRKAQILSLMVLLIMPLLTSGVTGQLLDGAMHQAHIKFEHATVFIKEPYVTLVPKSIKSPSQPFPNQYVKFENVNILFRGLGANSVISFKDGKVERTLEIPNDQLIVD